MSTYGSFDFTLTATNQSIFTAANPLVITAATAENTDSSARTVTLTRTTGGVTTGVIDGAQSNAFTLQPGQTRSLGLGGFVLNMGDSLNALASATSVVNLSCSYVVPS